MSLRTGDFESPASANFATPADENRERSVGGGGLGVNRFRVRMLVRTLLYWKGESPGYPTTVRHQQGTAAPMPITPQELDEEPVPAGEASIDDAAPPSALITEALASGLVCLKLDGLAVWLVD